MNLSRDELENLSLIAVLGLITGIGSFYFRYRVPQIFSVELVEFQYALISILLGMLPILFIRARTIEGRATALYLGISGFIALLIIPIDLVFNSLIVLTVLLGGITYFRFYSGTNYYLLLFIQVIVVEIYLWAMYVMVISLSEGGDLRLSLIVLFLTIVLALITKMFRKEYRKSKANTGAGGGAGWTP